MLIKVLCLVWILKFCHERIKNEGCLRRYYDTQLSVGFLENILCGTTFFKRLFIVLAIAISSFAIIIYMQCMGACVFVCMYVLSHVTQPPVYKCKKAYKVDLIAAPSTYRYFPIKLTCPAPASGLV